MSALKKLQDKLNKEKQPVTTTDNKDDWRLIDDKGNSLHKRIREEEQARKERVGN